MKLYSLNAVPYACRVLLVWITQWNGNHLWIQKTPLLVILISQTLPLNQRKMRISEMNSMEFLRTPSPNGLLHRILLRLLLQNLYHYDGLHN
jgi:hypothetical protein